MCTYYRTFKSGSEEPQPLIQPPNSDSKSSGLSTNKTAFPMKNSPQMLSAPATNQQRPRRKVFIKPGFSQLDWMRLSTSGEDLRGVNELQMLTLDEVAKHNKRDDCWTVICGRVYNVTRYLDFHPGGRGQLMRVAGKDGTKLFFETHAWVNFENMLKECLVGFVSQSSR